MPLIKWKDATTTWAQTVKIWSLVEEALAAAAGSTPSRRKKRLEKFLEDEPEKKKQLIQLIVRIEGIKVYDDTKEVLDDIEVTVEKIEMLAEKILGKKIKVENPNVI